MWALGDYHRFAKATVWELGPELVAACGVDGRASACSTSPRAPGNVALRAAEAGPRSWPPTSRRSTSRPAGARPRARGVELEWVEADAEALPFADGVVRRRHLVARRDLRARSRGGGRRARPRLPAGRDDRDDQLHARGPRRRRSSGSSPVTRHRPRPARGRRCGGAPRSTCARCSATASRRIETLRERYVERSAGGPLAYRDLFKETFGPLVGLYAALADQPDRLAALERDFTDFAVRADEGPPGGPAEYPYEYLRVVARKRGG